MAHVSSDGQLVPGGWCTLHSLLWHGHAHGHAHATHTMAKNIRENVTINITISAKQKLCLVFIECTLSKSLPDMTILN